MIETFNDTQIVIIAISPNILCLPFLYMLINDCILLRVGGAADLTVVTSIHTATCVPADISPVIDDDRL